MKLKRVIAIMAVVLTLAASAPAAFAATDPGETTSQTVENQNSEENILIEFDLETGEERRKVIVGPEQDLDYYSPGTLGADIPSYHTSFRNKELLHSHLPLMILFSLIIYITERYAILLLLFLTERQETELVLLWGKIQ